MRRRFQLVRSIALLAVILLIQILFFAGTITFGFSGISLQQAVVDPDIEESILFRFIQSLIDIGEIFSHLSLRLLYGMSIISMISVGLVISVVLLRKRLNDAARINILDTASFAGLCSLGAGLCCIMQYYHTSVMMGIYILFWTLLLLPVFWLTIRDDAMSPKLSYVFHIWMLINTVFALLVILFPKMNAFLPGNVSCFLLVFSFNLLTSVSDLLILFRKGRRKIYSFILLSNLSMLAVAALGLLSNLTGLSDFINFLMQAGLLFSGLCLSLHALWNTLRRSILYQSYDALRQREEENRLVAQYSSRYLIRYEHGTRNMICREESCQLLGMPRIMENMPDSFPTQYVSSKTQMNLRKLWHQVLAGEENGSATICYHQPVTGETLWLRIDFITSFHPDQQPDYTIFSFYILKGVQNREETYRNLQAENARLVRQGAVVYEADLTENRFLSVKGTPLYGMPELPSDGLEEFSGYLDEYMLEEGATLGKLLSREWLAEQYEGDNLSHSLEFQRITMNNPRWTRLGVQLLTEPYSDNILAFFVFEDIEEEYRQRDAGEMYHCDDLTGLLARSSFTDSFTRLLETSGENDIHVLYMVDLDGFKYVNDTYGHAFGDKVLREAADSLRSLFRSDDLICRFGGDEFVLCMKNVQDDSNFILHRGRQIIQSLSRQFGEEVVVGASVGASVFPRHSRDFDTLFRRADQALYRAKNTGRNLCVIYDESFSQGDRIVMTVQDEPQLPENPRRQILILDDEKLNRSVLKGDYHLLEASSFNQAKTLLEQSSDCCAALVNVTSPALDGAELIRWAKNQDKDQQIQILALIAQEDPNGETASGAIQLGADDVITLPVSPSLLQLRINNLLLCGETHRLRTRNQSLLLQQASKSRSQKQLQYLADHDAVTHIFNKGAFFRRTRTLLDEYPDKPFAIVCFDIIRFRVVNDIFGFDAGDRLLRYIASQLLTIVGEKGICARIATDMFAMCIPDEENQVKDVLDSLSSSLRGNHFRFVIQLCYGVYSVRDRNLSINQMLDHASMAKRTVKGAYVRNIAHYDDSMSLRLQEEQQLLSDMEAGLEKGEFQVFYQPKCRLDTGKVVGAEALIRWNHPQRGLLLPGVFVPIFEKNGFITKLDEYVWEQVCIFLKKCRERNPDCTPHISVNLSRVDLYNPHLCDTLEALCRRYDIPNEQMEVEITESAYVDNAHLLLDLAEKFHQHGFNVQMDDFGSGYSSLNMLNEIPVDVLKLDMRFLYHFSREGRSSSILSSIVNMTRNLRISVVAEGVETEEQARFLAGIGCRHAQGYYYHRPMTQEDFLELLQREMVQSSSVKDRESARLYLTRLLTPALLVSRQKDEITMLSSNEYYFSMVQITDANFSRSDRVLNHWIGPQDEKTLTQAMDAAKNAGKSVSCCYLQQDLSGRYHMLDCVVEYVTWENDCDLFVMILMERS